MIEGIIRAPMRFILLDLLEIAKIPSAVEVKRIRIPRGFEKIITNKVMIPITIIDRIE
ncbi:MAG: hypothetical protein QXS38_00300 [Candidatus Pacearchaeota archaeon]